MSIRELRLTAEAARRDWQAVADDPTASEGEIRKAKRVANEAHHRWLDAATERMCGDQYEVNHATN